MSFSKKRKRVLEKRKQTTSTFATINKLRALLTRRDKIILCFLFVGMIAFSVIETASISIIMPFITFASKPELIFANPYSKAIYEFFAFENTFSFMLFFCEALVGFYIFRALYGIFYTYCLARFSFRKFHYFAYRLFNKAVELNYTDFVKRKTDKIRSTIANEALSASSYMQYFLQIFAEIFTIIIMYVLLLFTSWKMTLVLSVVLSVQVFLIITILGGKLKKVGATRLQTQAKFNEIITKTFGNFKIIKLKGNQEEVCQEFDDVSRKLTNAQIFFSTSQPAPRYLLESLGFGILVGCVAYILLYYKDFDRVLPIISMYALALYRILPSVNRILQFYGQMAFNSKSVSAVYDDLLYHTDPEDSRPCDFKEKIELKNISFYYDANKPIIENFNLTIFKGDKIAFCGSSGAGKSTLVDLIIGIYKPKEGKILVDNVEINNHNLRSWRKKIGYIPQTIYLFDGSVAENVAFGSMMEESRVIEACRKANILDFLNEHNGIYTRVGEGGILLSGGQKQRIGIARAIYDDPEILVLDEATSALDSQTEAKIMDQVYDVAQNKTLLVIAHRLNTIERCERKIELKRA
ncbi:ABC transporter ATP-binding protein [Helicobacter himalayensis]|uniref:ABC transporter ATP-binding protein n=1 Tax=Helicobacter himalayensis TaxID=1591088 RepID=UPI0009ECE0BD|nr:ABC transporter ATP-binding protein [Helicobacter himalayensis]